MRNEILVIALLVAALARAASAVPTYEFTLLHTFYTDTNVGEFGTAPEGYQPTGLAIDANGNLFGTNFHGGPCLLNPNNGDCSGTLWELPAGGGELVLLHNFVNDLNGVRPESVLVDSNGDLYGTTVLRLPTDPVGYGSVWRVPNNSGALSTLYPFTGVVDGHSPRPLVLDGNGILHGISVSSPSPLIFGLPKVGGSIATAVVGLPTVNRFLTLDAEGNLFGTSQSGGAHGHGAIFELPHASSTVGIRYAFPGGSEGDLPTGQLVVDDDGNLLGVTTYGGENNLGTVFELPNGATAVTILHHFTGGDDGRNPVVGLMHDGGGNLFGTTLAGGANDKGTVFVLPIGGSLTTLYDFSAQQSFGPTPLVIDADGNLFGVGNGGGPPPSPGVVASGFVFELRPLPPTNELVFAQQPSNAPVATAIAPAVVVHETDDQGVLISTFNGEVTLSIDFGPLGAMIGGTVTVDAVGGIATFADVRLDRAGTYTLEASDGTLIATSTPFTVPEPAGATTAALIALAITTACRRGSATRDSSRCSPSAAR